MCGLKISMIVREGIIFLLWLKLVVLQIYVVDKKKIKVVILAMWRERIF